ncbi:hypothetical protein [Providencia sp. wls1916]|uniref:hypothetical protein n=1 Tax=Providencia sp. wls1916 TaxID=2675155 RepID=UPI0012B5EB2B|nr:hypothetical protein [Providencia sp. wls1916]MTC77722.1 hypothetical protein [Providencia sp. wls1916]
MYLYTGEVEMTDTFENSNYFKITEEIYNKKTPKIKISTLANSVARNLSNHLGLILFSSSSSEYENYQNKSVYGFWVHPKTKSVDIPHTVFYGAMFLYQKGDLLDNNKDSYNNNTDPIILKIKFYRVLDNTVKELSAEVFSFSIKKQNIIIFHDSSEEYFPSKKQYELPKVLDEQWYHDRSTDISKWILNTIQESR